MHPGFHAWWKRAHEARVCGEGCGPSQPSQGGHEAHDHEDHHGPPPWARRGWGRGGAGPEEARFGGGGGGGDDDGSAGFGVRRPLRFLAHKLELEEGQVAELAAILNELKIERAQASVDNRRRIGALAETLDAESFDEAKAVAIGGDQVKTEERLQTAITKALGRIHGILKPEQRKKLAYLLRTGVLSI